MRMVWRSQRKGEEGVCGGGVTPWVRWSWWHLLLMPPLGVAWPWDARGELEKWEQSPW